METLAYLVFLGCSIVALAILAHRDTKAIKRQWDYKERLLEAINHNTESVDKIAKALMYEK